MPIVLAAAVFCLSPSVHDGDTIRCDRERVQIARLRALAEESHLDPAFAEKFLNFIVAEVIHHHEQIASTGTIETHP